MIISVFPNLFWQQEDADYHADEYYNYEYQYYV